MKKFVLLHYGFEKPTPEIMAAWGKWFEATKPHAVDMGGFGNGREISKGGTRDLPLGTDSITGFTIVNAANLDDAEKIAQGNPFISSIRVYEVRSSLESLRLGNRRSRTESRRRRGKEHASYCKCLRSSPA